MLTELQLNQISSIIEKAITPNLKYTFYVECVTEYSGSFKIHRFFIDYLGKKLYLDSISEYLGGNDLHNKDSLNRDLDLFRRSFGHTISSVVTKLREHEVLVDAQRLIDTEPMFKDLF